MKLVEFSIHRRVTITMFFLATIIFGWIAFNRLSIDLLPNITYPTLTIRTEYPGTAPAEVENLISKPIEEAVGVVNGVIQVSSISRSGVSDVVVEFNWDTNMDFASLNVREKLDRVKLPKDATQPILLRYDPALEPILRIALYGDQNLIALRLLAEEKIKQELESLDGVAAAQVSGGLEEEIHVDVNEAKMAALKIPITLVTNRLSQENINLTGGTLDEGDTQYIVRTLNQFLTADEINDVVIARRGKAVVRLQDIGRAYKSYKDRKVITRVNGHESVEIAIYKEASTNTVAVADRVKKKLAVIQKEIQAVSGNTHLAIVADQSQFIRNSVNDVLSSAIIGGVLAMIILFFFLRNLRSTLIISLAIPISVVSTFFLMYLSHVSLNVMSLGGLALGVGMMVDSAIVVLESIDRYRKKGLSLMDAANKGTSEVGMAVVASTLTTVFVFVPIIFVKGIAGQLFTDEALTVTYSLLMSLLVAITLIPMLSALGGYGSGQNPVPSVSPKKSSKLSRAVEVFFVTLLRGMKQAGVWFGKGLLILLWPFQWVFDKFYKWTVRVYPPTIKWALTHRTQTVVIALALFGLSYLAYLSLGTELIPEMSQGEFIVDVKLPVGTPIEETDRVIQNMVTMGSNDPRILRIYAVAGSITQTGVSASEEQENLGQLLVKLKPGILKEKETRVMEDLRWKWETLPGVAVEFSRPSYFSFKTPIEVEVQGYNLDVLDALSKHIASKMREIPGLVDVKSTMEGGNPEIQIQFNRNRVAQLGTDIGTIASLIRNEIQGDVATQLNRRDRKIDIRVRAKKRDRRTIEALKRIIVNPGSSVPVPLFSVANISIERGPSEIRRIDQERVAVISANVEGRDLGSAARDIRKAISKIELPPEMRVRIGGQNAEMSVSFESMKFAIFLAIFLVYLVMASQFESLLHPFVIMFTIPFGLVGVFFTLFIFRETISVVVLIGVIMLAGIVVNNAIVLVDYINHLRRVEKMPKFEAIVEAGKVRLRPILMTATTTVLGLLPLALGLGEGSEVRSPMAITVIGGLIMATFLTLVFIPTIYSLMEKSEK